MPSFDIVSKLQWHEVDNAVAQAQKEVAQRFDFKDTHTEIEKKEKEIALRSSTEDRVRAALMVVQEKLVKRKVSSKHLEVGKPEPTAKGGSRITITLKEGIEADKAKAIVQTLKDVKSKAQASIQGDQLRVSGKNRDDLQACIQLLREKDFGIELQYINFRE